MVVRFLGDFHRAAARVGAIGESLVELREPAGRRRVPVAAVRGPAERAARIPHHPVFRRENPVREKLPLFPASFEVAKSNTLKRLLSAARPF